MGGWPYCCRFDSHQLMIFAAAAADFLQQRSLIAVCIYYRYAFATGCYVGMAARQHSVQSP